MGPTSSMRRYAEVIHEPERGEGRATTPRGPRASRPRPRKSRRQTAATTLASLPRTRWAADLQRDKDVVNIV